MNGRVYTVTAGLDKTAEFEKYFGEYIAEYNRIYRFMWRKMAAPDFRERFCSDSAFVSYICRRFGVMKRTVNSLRYDINGRIKALKEHKRYLIKELGYRQNAYAKEIKELARIVEEKRILARTNLLDEEQLEAYMVARRRLYKLRNRLNAFTQRRERLRLELKMNILKLGFGGRSMFRKQHHLEENGYRTHQGWYNDYVRQRDKNIFYLGSSDETCGNQMLQMSAEEGKDTFRLKIRKEYNYEDTGRYLNISDVKIGYLRDEIEECVKGHAEKVTGRKPLTYRVIRRGKRWYIQIIFAMTGKSISTESSHGTIGLDFNRGFIQMSETDSKGNLFHMERHVVSVDGSKNRKIDELRKVINCLTDRAAETGKNIVAEDLDFTRKRARQIKNEGIKGKRHRRLINTLEYSRYLVLLKNACDKKGIGLIIVNPAFTSIKGEERYCDRKKLNIHQAAAYVIARKGQGLSA